MPETGNNNSVVKSLSILIHRGGLSFYDNVSHTQEHYHRSTGSVLSSQEVCAALEGYYSLHPEKESAKVMIANGKNIMIPEVLFDPLMIKEYFHNIGKHLSAERYKMTWQTYDGIVFITAVEQSIHERLVTIYKDLEITNPLLQSVMARRIIDDYGAVITLDTAGDNLTVTLWNDDRLLFADNLPVNNGDDLVFYIERLRKDHELESPKVVCVGASGAITARITEKYYDVEVIDFEDYFNLPYIARP